MNTQQTNFLQHLKPPSQSFLSGVLILLLLLIVMTTNPVTAAQINVQVDRNPVNLSESFQLIFSADTSPDDDPDFRVLESDFEIINQSQSSNISMINGSVSRSKSWTLTVMAKQAGVIQVPAVTFGSDLSPAVRLMVNKGNNTSSNSQPNDDIFIQVSASSEQVIVQSQIIYTLRIYRKVDITQANLTEPKPADTLIERLGKDSEFNTELNGQAYQVIERKYALFPQKSGLLTIDPVVLTASVVIGNNRALGGFFNRPRTRNKRVISEPLVIDVQPIPANVQTPHWLPAEHVYLDQKWSGDTTQLRAGEPITRTITLMAKGTTVGQLPELSNSKQRVRSNSGGELKNYPDQPLLKEKNTSESMIAFREEKTAIIPSKAGVYQLPAIEIPWWNTRTQQMQFARIPATTLTAVGVAVSQPTTPFQDNPAPDQVSNEISSNSTNILHNFWFWLALFFGTAWLITLVLWYLSKKQIQKTKSTLLNPAHFDDRALKQACREHNPVAAKNELILWGRQQWQLSNLGKIAKQCDPELQAAILALNNALYSQQASPWQGEPLLSAFNNQTRKTVDQENQQAQVLLPLYKL